MVEQAAGTLKNVNANKDLWAAVVQAGALPLLIDLLSHVDEKVQEQAGVALAQPFRHSQIIIMMMIR